MIWVIIVLGIIALVLLNSYLAAQKSVKVETAKYAELFDKYKDIIDLEKTKSELNNSVQELTKIYGTYKTTAELDTKIKEFESKISTFQNSIDNLSKQKNELEEATKAFSESYEMIEFGLYQPYYNFGSSEDYKKTLEKYRNQQKELLKANKAVHSKIKWTVGNSEKAGEKMTRDYSKLMLQAFNGESDSLIVKVKHDNIVKYIDRLRKEKDIINKIAATQGCEITEEYLQLKINELKLVHEYQTKVYEEKEEQRLIKEQMREEEKARREFEKALKDVQEEEKRFEKALEEAKKQLDKATDTEKQGLEAKIAELMNQLETAKQKERAVSQAQLTKCGHIYIISNIGSFGEHVYKVGMTRRLEPMERVKELGDASVPFEFDVHGFIYSENAPDLEKKLHRLLDEHRLNKVNERREFFKVELDKIENILKQEKVKYELTKLAEAKEYRESMALLNSKNN